MTALAAAGGGTAFRIFAAAVVLVGGAGCVWTILAGKKGVPIHRIYLVTALLFGSIYLILIPTYSAPDEEDHFKSAYWDADCGETRSLMEDPWLMGMRKCDLVYDGYLDEKSDYDDFLATFARPAAEDISEWDYTLIEYSGNSFNYLLPILGIRLALSLGLSFGWLCMFATIPNMLFFILMTTYAIYRLPYGKRTLFVIALLPITLQQTSSVSYDCPLLAASFLATGLALHWMADGFPLQKGCFSIREKAGRCAIADLVLFALSAVILYKCKGGAYLPLLLLAAAFCVGRRPLFKTRRRRLLAAAAVLAAVALFLLLGGWQRIGDFLTTAPYRNRFSDYGYSPEDFLNNPSYLLAVLGNTFLSCGALWLYELFGGNLGWININVSGLLIRLEMVLFLLSLIRCGGEDSAEAEGIQTAGIRAAGIRAAGMEAGGLCAAGSMTPGRRIAAFLLALIPCAISVAAMLIYWTEKNAMLIDGVQGRYFLPCLFAMGLAFGYWRKPVIRWNTDRAVTGAAAILSYLVMLDVLWII